MNPGLAFFLFYIPVWVLLGLYLHERSLRMKQNREWGDEVKRVTQKAQALRELPTVCPAATVQRKVLS